MQLIPVLDIRDGVVVHARQGHRDRYQPIRSQLCASTDPLEMLRCLHRRLDCKACYVADLNALMGGSIQKTVLEQLTEVGLPLWIDAGIRTTHDILHLSHLANIRIVLASEAVASSDVLTSTEITQLKLPPLFSFDFRHGHLQIAADQWTALPADQLATEVAESGITDWIILDIAAVGSEQGPTTVDLCDGLRRQFPAATLTTGGGIRSVADLTRLKNAGISFALVSTALHDGSLNDFLDGRCPWS